MRACGGSKTRFGDEAGGNGGGEAPGTMPNPEVKLFSADGTTDVDLWESRELPDLIAFKNLRAAYVRKHVGSLFIFKKMFTKTETN